MLDDQPTGNSQSGRSWPIARPYLTGILEYGLMIFAFFVLFATVNHWMEYLFLALVGVWVIRDFGSRPFRVERTALDLPLLLFLGWVLITVATAADPAYSFAEWRKSLTKVLMLYFVVNVVVEERQVRRIVLACVGGVCAHTVIAIVHFANGDGEIGSLAVREGGWTSSGMWLGSYLVMALPLLWLGLPGSSRRSVRWFSVVASCFALVALFLTHIRAAWVALLVQVCVLAVLKLRRSGVMATVVAALVVLGVLAAVGLLGGPSEMHGTVEMADAKSMMVRFNTWKLALSEILAHPLTGLGYGRHSFRVVHPEAVIENGYHSHVHNTFLSMAVQVGLPGFLLFCWVFYRILTVAFETWERTRDQYSGRLALALLLVTVGVIVRNLFDDMFVGTLVYLFWLLVGLLFSLKPRAPAYAGQDGSA